LADADNLLNDPWSYVGNCPPAETVLVGTNYYCGDVRMQVSLPAGNYTLLLTDANYIPNAVYTNGTTDEGFTDFTAGVFQTCYPVENTCITPNGTWALDITTIPEPSALSLLGIGFTGLVGWKQVRKRRMTPCNKGAALL
jgi:hypothetical protein